MRYILSFLFALSFSLQAAEPTEKEQLRSIVAKLQDYTESFADLMEDRLNRIVDIPLDYERRKIQEGPEAAISHYRVLFNVPTLTEGGLLEYAHLQLPRMKQNTEISAEFKQKIEDSKSYKTPQGQASFLFEYLMNRHHNYVAQHTKEWLEGKVPCCDPTKFDQMKSSFDRVTVETALSAYRQNLYFLKKLYPLLDMAYLDDTSRRILILDKHLRDILEGRNTKPDHPEAGFETFPHQHFLPMLFKTVIHQATATTTPKDLNRIRDDLAKRPPLLIYLKTKPHLVNTEIATYAEGHIDFEALSKIPPQNQLSNVIIQGRTLIGRQSESFLRKEYRDWQEKNAKPKPAPQPTSQVSNTKKKKKGARVQPAQAIATSSDTSAEVASPAVYDVPAIEPKPEPIQDPTFRVEGHEKDREARRAAWEAKQAAEGPQESSSETASSQYEFSETTRNTLKIIFKMTTPENLKWDDFVSAWKELRKVIDGVENAELITKSGSARKFQGGPIQEGRKQKPRSFVIHEPHKSDGHTLGFKAQDRIATFFEEKFGWTQKKLNLD